MDDIDAAVKKERERCVAWALTFTLITELLDGIESGKWPPQESKRAPKQP
jgi:hypothetical protein